MGKFIATKKERCPSLKALLRRSSTGICVNVKEFRGFKSLPLSEAILEKLQYGANPLEH